jgi:carboxyl-terminal processing protease
MKRNRLIIIVTLLISFGSVIFSSCEKEKIYPTDYNTTRELYSLMNEWYLWKDSMPDVNVDNYDTPDELLEAMRYSPRDKWSYISTENEYAQYYEEGTYVGYGFGYSTDSEGNVRVTFIYEDSDLYDFGIKRSWKINKINGASIDEYSAIGTLLGDDELGVENTIEFESPTGTIVSETFSKKLVTMNTVGSKQVITSGANKVGYFVFKSFIGPSNDELTETFSEFKAQGVNELVIDLRYNGGGRMDVVTHLAGLIIPDNLNGEMFLKYEHNADQSGENSEYLFEQEAESLKLDKVYFITSKGSASASEAIINGLDPYIETYIVGNDTYGKPVGMYSFSSRVSDLIYVPISFRLVNSNNYGGYYSGLAADSYVEDDLYNDFGEDEATLKEVLFHIENGSFSSTKSSYDIYSRPKKEIRNLKDELGSI